MNIALYRTHVCSPYLHVVLPYLVFCHVAHMGNGAPRAVRVHTLHASSTVPGDGMRRHG